MSSCRAVAVRAESRGGKPRVAALAASAAQSVSWSSASNTEWPSATLADVSHAAHRACRMVIPDVAKSPSWKPPEMCASAVRAPAT